MNTIKILVSSLLD